MAGRFYHNIINIRFHFIMNWELSKENFQPLRKGRHPEIHKNAFESTNFPKSTKNLEHERQYVAKKNFVFF